MSIAPERSELVSDDRRQELIRIAQEVDRAAGIPDAPTMTIEELHESMLAHGVRPEDNIGSREIIRMRYGDDCDQD